MASPGPGNLKRRRGQASAELQQQHEAMIKMLDEHISRTVLQVEQSKASLRLHHHDLTTARRQADAAHKAVVNLQSTSEMTNDLKHLQSMLETIQGAQKQHETFMNAKKNEPDCRDGASVSGAGESLAVIGARCICAGVEALNKEKAARDERKRLVEDQLAEERDGLAAEEQAMRVAQDELADMEEELDNLRTKKANWSTT
ncbi:translation initiation factor IF-2 [Colletotrichum tofieldiae]|nr:translation initiation factor IF-2 [Colletotrichum tofieldiae]